MSGANPEALGGVLPVQAGAGAVVLPGTVIGSVLYWNGTLWVPLPPGLDGFQLTTHDIGLPPTWEAGTVAPVASVFGRVGAVVALAGDYSFPLISGTIDDTQHGNRGGGALHALATALAAGFMSAADFTKLAGLTAQAAPAVLGFGANNLTATTTTRYLFPWHSDNQAETSPTQYRLTRAGTLRNFRLRHNAPAGNGSDIVYTVRINSVATALTITLASTGTDGADLVNSVVVVAGDLIDVVATKAVGIGASPINIESSLEYAA